MSTREGSGEQSGRKKRSASRQVVEVKRKASKVVDVAIVERKKGESPFQKKRAAGVKKLAKSVSSARSKDIRATLKVVDGKNSDAPKEASTLEGLNIANLDAAQTERLIKTFRKASAAFGKSKPTRARVSYNNFLAKAPANAKKYAVDLRVHTPGTVGYFTSGGVEPGPALVRLAKIKGIDVLGLTDFYNASYIDIVHDSVKEADITILPGFDLCCEIGSCREVHITVMFPESYRTADLAQVLTELKVPSFAAGRSDYCLDLPFAEVVQIVERNGGILIPSQVDKTPYRQLAIPALVEQYGIRAFDLVHPENTEYFKERWPAGEFTFFSFSNSTALAQIGTRIAKVKLATPSFKGIKELIERKPEGILGLEEQ